VLATVALFSSLLIAHTQPAACADAPSCRQAAVEAAARSDYEAFHDLAWRAAQKGRPNDPDLMYLLARAQSLSGRPGDALVMLRRLAQLGVPTDARDSQDFERVRRLSGWAALESMVASSNEAGPPPPAGAVPPATTEPGARAAAPDTAALVAPKTGRSPAAAASPAARPGAESTLRLPAASLNPVGLAYDSASRRFVLGDGDDNKLMVADEVFNHVNDLIGAASAGFGRLSAVEIDTRRGDLWATSSDGDGAASIHKLQLVSGRVLSRIAIPSSLQPVTIDDLAVIDDGTLVVVDSRGARLLRVRTAGAQFERAVPLHVNAPSSIAPANGVIYVAHDAGLSVVQPASGRVSAVQPSTGVSLAGLRRIRWGGGALFAIQEEGAGSRLVKIHVSSNRRKATRVEALDGDMQSAGTALTFSRDAVYYVAKTDEGATIRRVEIR
jgi:hypothetical protein